MKCIIAGGREFDDYGLMVEAMTYFSSKPGIEIDTIISGRANGADTLGERYAEEYKLEVELFPADWRKYGKKAGFIRNSQMADCGDLLVAFWNGQSRGTKMMIGIAVKAGLKVLVVMYNIKMEKTYHEFNCECG